MSTFVLKKEYELQLPSSYVDIDREEMEYIDGGLGAPNWLVAGAANLAIDACTVGVIGTGSLALRNLASKYGTQAAKTMFSRQVKNKLLAKAVSATIASRIASLASVAFTVLLWAIDPGTQFASWYDSRDCRPSNGWCDIS